MGRHTKKPPVTGGSFSEQGAKKNEKETELQSLEEVRCPPEKEVKAPQITCGAPRWLVVVTYSIYAFLTGAAYFNWTPMVDMLYSDGAYEWLCTKEEINAFNASGADRTRPRCAEQELATGRLFSAMSASEFGFAAFAGFLLDTLGPKLTAMTGTLMALSGWVLLGLGRESLNTFIVASVLLGGSSETCFYPLLPAADLYPGWESTVMAIFGTFRSISLLIPLVMRAINIEAGVSTFRGIVLGFACICIGGCFLFAVFFIPRKAWPRQQERQEAQNPKAAKEESQPVVCETEATKEAIRGQELEKFRAWCRRQVGEGSYLREMCSWAFGLMAVAYVCVIITLMFFVPSTLHLIPDAYTANQVIQIFSFVPCPILGYAADRIGILWVMQFVNFCGFSTYFFVMVPRMPTYPAMQFAAAIFCSMQVSFMNSQLYCYGSRYLSQRNLGKLIGTAFCLAGFTSLSTNPMRRFALEHGFGPMCWVAIGLTLVVAVLLAILQLMDRNNMLKLRNNEEKGRENQGAEDQERKNVV